MISSSTSYDRPSLRHLAGRVLASSATAPLDPPVRREMEGMLGEDLGAVALHHGPDARAFCAMLGAEALTIGGDIVFAAGLPDLSGIEGRRLLAHELVHVVQNRRAGIVRGLPAVSRSEDAAELEADRLRPACWPGSGSMW